MSTTKTLLLIAALAASSNGVAGDYSKAQEKRSRCESAGQLAASFYGSDTKALRDTAADLDQKVKKKQITKDLAEETKYILFMGNTSNSKKDAYMKAWSWCMDFKK